MVIAASDAGLSAFVVDCDAAGLTAWDTALLAFLRGLMVRFNERGIETGRGGLPDGVNRLLDLADKGIDDLLALQREPLLEKFRGENIVKFVEKVA